MAKSTLRIKGLVAFSNRVRRLISGGLSEADAQSLREEVATVLSQVEAICRKQHKSSDELPAPSRRALQWLQQLEIQPGEGGEGQENRGEIRLSGLNPLLEEQLALLAASRTPQQLDSYLEQSDQLLEELHNKLKDINGSVVNLPMKQQRQLVRLELYRESPWTERLPFNALQLEGTFSALLPGHLFQLRFKPSDRQLWRVQDRSGTAQIEISDLFLTAVEPELCDKLAELISGRIGVRRGSRAARLRALDKQLRDWIYRGEPQQFKRSIEARLHHDPQLGRGAVYDLQEVFLRINRDYFAGKLQPAGVYWTPRNGRRRTGYYNPLTGEVFISAALDQPEVPPYVVDFIMYHELLHLEQDLAGKLGRGRRAHSAAFRRKEQAFPQFAQAERWLNRFAADG